MAENKWDWEKSEFGKYWAGVKLVWRGGSGECGGELRGREGESGKVVDCDDVEEEEG